MLGRDRRQGIGHGTRWECACCPRDDAEESTFQVEFSTAERPGPAKRARRYLLGHSHLSSATFELKNGVEGPYTTSKLLSVGLFLHREGGLYLIMHGRSRMATDPLFLQCRNGARLVSTDQTYIACTKHEAPREVMIVSRRKPANILGEQ